MSHTHKQLWCHEAKGTEWFWGLISGGFLWSLESDSLLGLQNPGLESTLQYSLPDASLPNRWKVSVCFAFYNGELTTS